MKIGRKQDRRERDRAPVNLFFSGAHPARAGRQGGKYANRAEAAVRKTAAGHECRRHDKPITSDTTEKDKNV